MAQYTYPYLCGHGHGTVRLYGKESDRQRKLAWYADTFVCPECYKKQKAEEDAAAPKTASLHLAVYGGVYQSIQVHGQLAANKEDLKQLGYRWGDDLDGGLLAFLRTPKRALQKWTLVESIDDIKRTAKQWADELSELGYKITAVPGLMDQQGARAFFDYAAKKAAEEQQKKEAAAKAEAEKQEKNQTVRPKAQPARMVPAAAQIQKILERQILRQRQTRLARVFGRQRDQSQRGRQRALRALARRTQRVAGLLAGLTTR